MRSPSTRHLYSMSARNSPFCGSLCSFLIAALSLPGSSVISIQVSPACGFSSECGASLRLMHGLSRASLSAAHRNVGAHWWFVGGPAAVMQHGRPSPRGTH